MHVIERRVAPALTGSLSFHAFLLAWLALMAARPSSPGPGDVTRPGKQPPLVWLSAGKSGGGGGGGEHTVETAPRATALGRDASTVRAAKTSPSLQASATPVDVVSTLIAPVMPSVSGTIELPGRIDAPPAAPSRTRGPGNGDGVGGGNGDGDGPGKGRGIGPGETAGIGDGPYQPGGDVSMPVEIRKGAPQYTADAMRARAQGSILVECVVQTNGMCSNIRVVGGLTPAFGLDEEAIKAAAQWRFRPGMRRGQPVPVLVRLEIEFAVR